MEDFKLLRGFDDENSIEPLVDTSASWMWAEEFHLSPVPNHDWVLRTVRCHGIRTFLNIFPDYFIVPVVSITGNDIRHCFGDRNGGNGWGFDVTSDLLTIEYYILLPHTTL